MPATRPLSPSLTVSSRSYGCQDKSGSRGLPVCGTAAHLLWYDAVESVARIWDKGAATLTTFDATHFGLQPGRPASRRERQTSARRQRLVTAALELFEQDGFSQTSVQAITERAELGHGTFYRYFRSKDDLLSKLVGAAVGKLSGYIIPPPSERDTILVQLRYGFRGLFQWFLDHRVALLAVRNAMGVDRGWEREWQRVRDFLFDHITLNIEWAKRKGFYRGADEEVAKLSAYHLMVGVGEELILRRPEPPDLDHLADELARICCFAFLTDTDVPLGG